MNPSFSGDLIKDLDQLFAFQFMRSALEAGGIVAILAAVAGWYMVLRRQSFAGHTLAVMAFPGATGASLAGLPASLGYYLAATAAAITIGRGGRESRSHSGETATIATVQTVGLAAGFVFLSLNHAVLGGPESLLFGTFLGITQGQVLTLLCVAVGLLLVIAAIGRPLLFATVDRDAAGAQGVPIRALDAAFLVILGLAVAAASQITGVLLVFALLVAPAASAQLITTRPLASLMLSVALALVVAWLGLAIAYFSTYPVGFYTTTLAMALYLIARSVAALRRRRSA
jgi:zinc/manganese transport system permease protein